MAEYKGLKCKTRGNASIQGKQRVFFCCQENDFALYWESITEEILGIQRDAAVWYYDPAEGIPEGEEFLADLSRMQLFVVPITGNFIYKENQARTVEFRYALEHHIPLLPLMQENGLEQDFNRVCGDLQFLNPYAAEYDPTVIPYEEKLKKFLESVLISNALAEKVRADFDAYIFLSYRKKDRKYAREIMNRIHANDFCRDIAIWYDEFLTVGENFNASIAAALEKCSVFALTVTPNLLENPNYVMVTEYPAAKKAGKTVLPIEAIDTDRNELALLYEEIDDPIRMENTQDLAAGLKQKLKNIASGRRNNDPKHLFYMGLAYLAGIDVEIHHERALKLITEAAEAGLLEACQKLVFMYSYGEGVERDYLKAARWQETYVNLLEQSMENPFANEVLFEELWELGTMWAGLGNLAEAMATFKKMLVHVSGKCEGNPSYENQMEFAIVCRQIGYIFRENENLYEAKECFKQSMEILSLLEEEEGASLISRLGICLLHEALGEICICEENMEEARGHYLACVEIYTHLMEVSEMDGLQSCLAHAFKGVGDVYYEEGSLKEAQEYFQKSLEIFQLVWEENETPDCARDVSLAYERLGNICVKEGNIERAGEYYQKCLEIRQAVLEETETLESKRNLSRIYQKLEDISETEG